MSEQAKARVSLTIFEWHELLKELEYKMAIRNRDPSVAIRLYEKIASQLSNTPVKVRQ